jgi:methylated-DNA-[protein]-cysteine S-methyltransferase
MITSFQKKVYAVVKKIPKQKTRSYKWVAEKIGNPKAARAVGQALKKNPFLGKVPCHRVIRSDGKLGGYAGGAKKKKQLLKQEGVQSLDVNA